MMYLYLHLPTHKDKYLELQGQRGPDQCYFGTYTAKPLKVEQTITPKRSNAKNRGNHRANAQTLKMVATTKQLNR